MAAITNRPGWTWVKNTAEVAAVSMAGALIHAWAKAPQPYLESIDWHDAIDGGAYEAIGVVGYALLALRVKNGTWSGIKKVVAADKVVVNKVDSEPKP